MEENAKTLRIHEVPKMQRLPFLQRIRRKARMKSKQGKQDINNQFSGPQIDLLK